MNSKTPRPGSMERLNSEKSKIKEVKTQIISSENKKEMQRMIESKHDSYYFCLYLNIVLSVIFFIGCAICFALENIALFFICGFIVIFEIIIVLLLNEKFPRLKIEISEDEKEVYNIMNNICVYLRSFSQISIIKSEKENIYVKVNAGCSSSLELDKFIIEKTQNPYLEFKGLGRQLWQMTFNGTKYIFSPVGLICFSGIQMWVLDYKDLTCKIRKTTWVNNFSEEPKDSKLIGHTYKYVNVDGSPDLRFSGNYKIKQYEYAHLDLYNSNKLFVSLLVSSYDKANNIYKLFLQNDKVNPK